MADRAVLFLCTGNSARSQMAEAYLREYAGEHFDVYSAGLEPSVVNPLTVRAMSEVGIDISGQRSKNVEELRGKKEFDYVVFVCSAADDRCPGVFPGARQRLAWPFDDPAAATGTEEERLQKFREVREEIGKKIRGWLAELRAAGELPAA